MELLKFGNPGEQAQTMSSLQIAELTGKRHDNVLEAIRKMEPAWEKISGLKFKEAEYLDAQGKKRPMYNLTKTESLYIATKFNDEARAKLVLRWEELENYDKLIIDTKLKYYQTKLNAITFLSNEIKITDDVIRESMKLRKKYQRNLNKIIRDDSGQLSITEFQIGFINKSENLIEE